MSETMFHIALDEQDEDDAFVLTRVGVEAGQARPGDRGRPRGRRLGAGAGSKRGLQAAAFVAAVTMGWTSGAEAQSAADAARTYFESGTLAFGEARWIDCAADFERSFAIVFAPELLYNIGLCYERAARALPDAQARPLLERALAAYQRYVRELPDASDVATVRTSIADLQARLEGVEGAVVEEATDADELVAPPPSPTPAEPEATPVGAPPEPEADEAYARAAPTYAITITGGALTVVALAVAIGLGAHAQAVYSRLASTCGATAAGCTEAQISEVADLSTGANAMYVAAGVMLAGTAVGFAIEFTAVAEPAPTSAVIAVRGRF